MEYKTFSENEWNKMPSTVTLVLYNQLVISMQSISEQNLQILDINKQNASQLKKLIEQDAEKTKRLEE